MKLIYLGDKLDTTVEHELFSNNEFGFNITIIYSEDSWMCVHEEKIVIEYLKNYTEVHHLYDDDNKRIAFESDIKRNGCNHNVSDIKMVTIELADKI
jgi:hypothetical protein